MPGAVPPNMESSGSLVSEGRLNGCDSATGAIGAGTRAGETVNSAHDFAANAMSRWMERRWTRSISREAGAALRFAASLLLVLQLLYTPIHLYGVPHSDEADLPATGLASTAAFTGDEGHEGDGNHERHSAAQHKLKVLRFQRAPVAEMVMVAAADWVVAETSCPQAPAFEFSGLSPPELPRSWQFFIRAALPVRAPSCLS